MGLKVKAHKWRGRLLKGNVGSVCEVSVDAIHVEHVLGFSNWNLCQKNLTQMEPNVGEYEGSYGCDQVSYECCGITA